MTPPVMYISLKIDFHGKSLCKQAVFVERASVRVTSQRFSNFKTLSLGRAGPVSIVGVECAVAERAMGGSVKSVPSEGGAHSQC